MKALKTTIAYWAELEDYILVPKNKVIYSAQFDLFEALIALPAIKRNKTVNNLIALLKKNLEVYESSLACKNKATAVDVLISLMEEHELTQSDLPEIGGQSLVSKILKGERKLTAEHIRKLSKRFHLSPSVFFD